MIPVELFNHVAHIVGAQARRIWGGKGKGGIYPPNNMNYNPLLTWLQIYLKIYNGVFTAIIVTVHSLQYIIEAFALYREKNVAWQIVLL